MRQVLRSKIHKATVTEAKLEYIGSMTVDQDLLDKVDLWPNEKVFVTSLTSGARIETYLLPGERDSGQICMNGPSAHMIKVGEEIIIMGFAYTDKPVEPKLILVDKNNRFVKYI